MSEDNPHIEVPRVPIPAGAGTNFQRFGANHPELLAAGAALNAAVTRGRAVDPVTQEAARLRTARYHACGR